MASCGASSTGSASPIAATELAARLAIGLLAAAVLAGCMLVTPKPVAPAAGAPPALPPWSIAEADLASQRLFRVHYSGPEGDGSFRVTLRLATPDAYQVTAADALGRPVWSLAVDGDHGLFLDHARQRFCRFGGALDLESLPLAPFPLPSLPALLLGRLPAVPAADLVKTRGARVDYRDEKDRRWSAIVEDGRVRQWTLWIDDTPTVWWTHAGEEAVLSDRRDSVQVRWRESLREPMPGPLPAPEEVPEAYASGCGRRE